MATTPPVHRVKSLWEGPEAQPRCQGLTRMSHMRCRTGQEKGGEARVSRSKPWLCGSLRLLLAFVLPLGTWPRISQARCEDAAMSMPCQCQDGPGPPRLLQQQLGMPWGAVTGLMLSTACADERFHLGSAGWSCWTCPAAQGAVGLSSHSSHSALGTQSCAAALRSQSRVVPVPIPAPSRASVGARASVRLCLTLLGCSTFG